MPKVSRTFRIDRSLSEAMDKIYIRHGDNTYHLEAALSQYGPIKAVVNPGVPVVKKADNPANESEFAHIWELYGKKGNRKVSKARYLGLSSATRLLVIDKVPAYVLSTPEKQYRKDFQSYLNLECWNDEVITNDQSHQRLNQPRKSLSERTADQARQIWAECEAEEAGERVMDKNGSIIPAKMEFIGG